MLSNMEEMRALAKEYYQLVVVEKRLLSDPEVQLNQVKYQMLVTTSTLDAH